MHNAITWKQFETDVHTLAKYIKNDIDIIIGIGRGGWIPAVCLSHQIGVKEVYNFSIQSYNDKNKKNTTSTIGQQPSNSFYYENRHKRVLVIDDLSDKGQTLISIKNYFADRGVHPVFATLYIKNSTEFIPDVYVRAYGDDNWLVFPWEKQ
jgi:hypothetical protein